MDINNASNISSSPISRINIATAKSAFEAAKKAPKNDEIDDFKEDDMKLASKKIQKPTVDVADIQKYAGYAGETLTIEDINYGLMYGRSVIADYIA